MNDPTVYPPGTAFPRRTWPGGPPQPDAGQVPTEDTYVDEGDADRAGADSFLPGQLVSWTYHDDYGPGPGGAERTVIALVAGVDEDGARLVVLPEASGPISFDQLTAL